MTTKYKRKKINPKSRKNKQLAIVQAIHKKNCLWKWWKEKGIYYGRKKWKTFEHNGPLFAPEYKPVPRNVKLYYDGNPIKLSRTAEEVAGFYGKMLSDDYTKKKIFNRNFFRDWRKVMTTKERDIIVNFKKCDFQEFYKFYKEEAEKKKLKNKEKKKKEKEELAARYGYCLVDGKIQKTGNFRMEPPGLFRGRGNHPKMGKLKKRILPEDVTINVSVNAPIPKPPPGHKWKEVVHNNTVTWLSRWEDNISKSTKYIMLHPSSKLKGENEIHKYELARELKRNLKDIRRYYMKDLSSPDEFDRQKAVVLYFIDKLALRTGYEKEVDTADTVGCCSLRVEHITLSPRRNGQRYVIHLDFPGKDSIRYCRSVSVDPRIYKNLQEFIKYKTSRSLIFETLNPILLNKYLNELMENLTAKVFRTCHASSELESQLKKMTKENMPLDEKIKIYNLANRSAAVLCNHQRAIPKSFTQTMKNIEKKIKEKTGEQKQLSKDIQMSKKTGDVKSLSKQLRKIKRLEIDIEKLIQQAINKVENKNIALGTTKLNYLDPRISVAWCKKYNVPIEKIYNKTQIERFQWAIETANANFKF